jgi:hypothetical protein
VVRTNIKLTTDQFQASADAAGADALVMTGAHRRLKDRSELIYPPPEGETKLRRYRICFALAPDYIDYANEVFASDGPMALVATTLSRASGLWRRAIGISLELCRKQGNLVSAKTCNHAELNVISGCAASECWCEGGESAASCKTATDCKPARGAASHPTDEQRVASGNTCRYSYDGGCDDVKYNPKAADWGCGPSGCCPADSDNSDCGIGTEAAVLNNMQCRNDAVQKVDAQPLLATDCNIFPSNFVDGFTQNGAGAVMLARMGVKHEDYDLAHYFGKAGGGGLGGLGVCADGSTMMPDRKAVGGTALSPPNGDSFNVDYVAHELGHQFGHGHTFAGNGGNCQPSNFLPNEAVELAGGRTILSYAGICEDTTEYNSDRNSRPFFASVSLGLYSKGQNDPTEHGGLLQKCGTVIGTGNQRPTAVATSQCTIPKSTPYELFGTGIGTSAPVAIHYTRRPDLVLVFQIPIQTIS